MLTSTVLLLCGFTGLVAGAPRSSPVVKHFRMTRQVDKCAQPAIVKPELYNAAVAATRTLPGTPTIDLANPSNNPANVQRVMGILPESTFEFLFPRRDKVAFTYLGLMQAIAKFPAWCDDAADPSQKDQACRKELASTFAHFVQETGENNPWVEQTMGIPLWRQALYFSREIGGWGYTTNCEDTEYWARYFPCKPGESYFGRGAKQLSYPYNYGPFSEVIFGDVTVLLNNPDLVASDPFLAFASAIWFGVTPQSPKPSMHDINTGRYVPGAAEAAANIGSGFGATIHVLNGGVECGGGGTTEKTQVQNRIAAYKNFAQYLGVEYTEEELGCRNMKPFPTNGVAAIPLYWEQSWAWESCNCAQVNYQTAFSLLSKTIGYDACTCHYFQAHCK